MVPAREGGLTASGLTVALAHSTCVIEIVETVLAYTSASLFVTPELTINKKGDAPLLVPGSTTEAFRIQKHRMKYRNINCIKLHLLGTSCEITSFKIMKLITS
ncbi:uncharacterized protein LOC144769590 [Lissotriton helveticus]